MKKLMIAAAIVCAAAMSQAASITWGSNEDLVNASGEVLQSTPYSFVLACVGNTTDGVDYKTAYTTDLKQGGTFEYYEDGYNMIGGSYGLNSDKDLANNIYAVLAKDASGNLYQINEYEGGSLIGTYTLSAWEGSDHPEFNFGVVGGSGMVIGAKIENVPEPTSGFLLLLGVAGLALRRRRA